MGLRAAPKEVSGISAAELAFGAPLALPGQFLGGPEAAESEQLSALCSGPCWVPTRPLEPADNTAGPFSQLREADFVYIRCGGHGPSLATVYSGPYRVIKRFPKFFTLDVGGGEDNVSIDRLKPHLGSSPVQPAVPPRKGRPPSSVSAPLGPPPGAG